MTGRETHNSLQETRRRSTAPHDGAARIPRSICCCLAQRGRAAMASLEAVMVTAFTLPFMITVLMFTVRAARFVYKMMSHLIGWPYL